MADGALGAKDGEMKILFGTADKEVAFPMLLCNNERRIQILTKICREGVEYESFVLHQLRATARERC